MHGIPESWVDRATADQLMILWEIVRRDDKNNFDITSYATANGVGLAFGGKNQCGEAIDKSMAFLFCLKIV